MCSIEAGISSLARRQDAMIDAVQSLAPQVDRLYLYLADYENVPFKACLPNVEIIRGQDVPDTVGDAHKFERAGGDGYYFSADDDLIYPPDYVETLVKKIEQYDRRAVVGLHGVILKRGAQHYYSDRMVFHGLGDLSRDTQVHVIGTCSCAYHSDTIKITKETFGSANIADIWLAKAAQDQNVPIMCVEHKKGWVRHTDKIDMKETLFENFHRNKKYPGNPIVKNTHWRLPKLI